MSAQSTAVLVTQPKNHAQALIDLLKTSLPEVRHFPAVGIRFLKPHTAQTQPTYVIATSPNAVTGAHKAKLALPENCAYFATGEGTASKLQAAGVKPIFTANPAGSEGLLALPQLDTAGHNCWLLTGKGGRGLLESELSNRGVNFERIETYERIPNDDASALMDSVNTPSLLIVTASSAEALDNLNHLADAETHAKLARSRWVVSSSRIAKALQQNWPQAQYKIATGPSATALYEGCLQWHKEQNHG